MRSLVPVAALVVALTGCGGDVKEDPGAEELPSLSTPSNSKKRPDRKPRAETTAPSAPAARKTFTAWLDASAEGAGERACALQTERFTRAQLRRAVDQGLVEPGTSCESLVATASQYYEVIGVDLTSADVNAGQVLGDRAEFIIVLQRVSLGYVLVRTDAGWRVDEDITLS